MAWSGEHFVFKDIILNGRLLILTQLSFCNQFALNWDDPIPDKKTMCTQIFQILGNPGLL